MEYMAPNLIIYKIVRSIAKINKKLIINYVKMNSLFILKFNINNIC